MADLINFTLPELNGEIDEKTIKQIKNYLYQLTEQMKFYLNNIDSDNFTQDYTRKLSEMITEASTNADNAYTKQLIDRYRRQFQKELEYSAELITGNKGGYIVLHDSDGDTFPDEILIMDTSDIATAQKIWRWNKNGLMFQNKATGAAAEVALTMEGKINANMITTGVLQGIRIEAAEGSIGGWDITEDGIKTKWTMPSPDGSTQVNYTLSLNAENNSSDNVIELTDGTNRYPFRIKRDGTADFGDLGVNNITVAGDFTCLGNMNFAYSGRLIWSGAYYMNQNQRINLKAPDLASDSHILYVNGDFEQTAIINFDGGKVEENALAGRTVVINNENYIVNSNTASSITLNEKITVSDNTEIQPDDGSYLLSNQMFGLALVFALYESGSVIKNFYHVEYFHKCMIYNTVNYVMTNHAFSRWSSKILTITNDQIIGNENNQKDTTTVGGITYNNMQWVLTAVYGI
nr:MAG TPA: tail protein [Caudoviricetes sp.]